MKLRIGTRWKHLGTSAIYIVLSVGPHEVIAWSLPVNNRPGIGGFAWLGSEVDFLNQFVTI